MNYEYVHRDFGYYIFKNNLEIIFPNETQQDAYSETSAIIMGNFKYGFNLVNDSNNNPTVSPKGWSQTFINDRLSYAQRYNIPPLSGQSNNRSLTWGQFDRVVQRWNSTHKDKFPYFILLGATIKKGQE